MTIYYRVNLQDGIKTEEQPIGYYAQHEDMNVSVFKSFRAAKRKFYAMTRSEDKRLKELRAKFRPINSREDLLAIEKQESHDGAK